MVVIVDLCVHYYPMQLTCNAQRDLEELQTELSPGLKNTKSMHGCLKTKLYTIIVVNINFIYGQCSNV